MKAFAVLFFSLAFGFFVYELSKSYRFDVKLWGFLKDLFSQLEKVRLLEKERSKLKAAIAHVTSKNQRYQETLNRYIVRLRRQNHHLKPIARENRELKVKIEVLNANIEALNTEKAGLQKDRQDLRDEMAFALKEFRSEMSVMKTRYEELDRIIERQAQPEKKIEEVKEETARDQVSRWMGQLDSLSFEERVEKLTEAPKVRESFVE